MKHVVICILFLACLAFGSAPADSAPVFTRREVIDRQGNKLSYDKSSVQFDQDSVLVFSEGDSLVVSFFAVDQDSPGDELLFALEDWSDFIHRTGSHLDSLALVDTFTITENDTARGFRVRLQLAFYVGDTSSVSDTLIISVFDGTTYVYDTMLFKVSNVNRAPIWDADTSSRPSDSAMVWSFEPAVLESGSIQNFPPITVTSGATDSIYFQQWVYDPDPLAGDSLGPAIAISQSGAPVDLFSSSGLMIVTISVPDTVSYSFTITATDSDPLNPLSSSKSLLLRVVPEPDIDRIIPPKAAPGEVITIYGSGFGLFDINASTPSMVRFRARGSTGVALNIPATINSWSRDRINLTIPRNVPISKFDNLNFQWIPDTIEVNSAVSASPAYYPYIIAESDTTKVTEMEVANLTPTSAVIKWKTDFIGIDSVILATDQDTLDIFTQNWPKTGPPFYPTFVNKLPDGSMSLIHANFMVYKGITPSTDQIHYVELTDLNPGTTYKFIIGMKNNLFFGDSTHNENGPWHPAKIDRYNSEMGGNSSISGFRLRTPPAHGTIGEIYEIYGKVFTTSGPATNALVTVKVVDYQNVADTSLGLVTTVATDSTWEVNLAGALKDTVGVQDRVFPHKEGDYLVITIRGDADVGYARFVATRGATGTSPQWVSTTDAGILLVPSVTYDIRLKVGLNLIGLPVELLPDELQTAEALLDRLAGGWPSISRYISATGTQERIIIKRFSSASREFIGYPDFPLELYKGYFVSVEGLNWLNIKGAVFGDTLPVLQFPGAALYWISRPAQESSKFYSWSARSMLANIDNATEIFRFQEDNQMYDSGILVESPPGSGKYQFIGSDFHIDVSEGYILRVTAASQWDIDTPTSVLLASANEKFNGEASEVPAITLNTSGEALISGSGAVRAIRLSDVTSSAARISWVTGIAGDALVRYGKAEEGLNRVSYLSKGLLAQGMCMVHLLNLEPETEYIFEIVSNGVTCNDNGRPFTLVTAKVGIGHPYTVYGRVVDEQGASLAKTLVYVEARRGENRSAPLLAITDDRGYWNVNLANLKTGNGLVYEWSIGDEIRVTLVHLDASLTFRALVSGESPQNVVKVDDPAAGTASKKEVSRVSLPKAFALGQNFPNPFNPSTTIAYSVPEENKMVMVSLRVYNLRGQLVSILVGELHEPGTYSVSWDGTNKAGHQVSSGVYLYRMQAGGFVQTRKMVLLK